MKVRRVDANFDVEDEMTTGRLYEEIARCYASVPQTSRLPPSRLTAEEQHDQTNRRGEAITVDTVESTRPRRLSPPAPTSAPVPPPLSRDRLSPTQQCIHDVTTTRTLRERGLRAKPGLSMTNMVAECFRDGALPSVQSATICVTKWVLHETVEPLHQRFSVERAEVQRCTFETKRVGAAAAMHGVMSLAQGSVADNAAGVPTDAADRNMDTGVLLDWGPYAQSDACYPAGWTSNIMSDFLARGLYAPQIVHWLTVFPPEQLLIIADEELYTNPAAALEQVAQHVGLPPFPTSVSGIDQAALNAAITQTFPMMEGQGWRLESTYDPMPDDVRAELVELYRPFNRELYHLLGRRFDAWDK